MVGDTSHGSPNNRSPASAEGRNAARFTVATCGQEVNAKMTISAEELLVFLLVLRTGKPLIAKVRRRILEAITDAARRSQFTRRRGVRLRVRVIDIWSEWSD